MIFIGPRTIRGGTIEPALLVQSTEPSPRSRPMAKWQHCVLEWRSEQVTFTVYGEPAELFPAHEWETRFADLGEQGWELVSTLPAANGAAYWYYFKRPLPS